MEMVSHRPLIRGALDPSRRAVIDYAHPGPATTATRVGQPSRGVGFCSAKPSHSWRRYVQAADLVSRLTALQVSTRPAAALIGSGRRRKPIRRTTRATTGPGSSSAESTCRIPSVLSTGSSRSRPTTPITSGSMVWTSATKTWPIPEQRKEMPARQFAISVPQVRRIESEAVLAKGKPVDRTLHLVLTLVTFGTCGVV